MQVETENNAKETEMYQAKRRRTESPIKLLEYTFAIPLHECLTQKCSRKCHSDIIDEIGYFVAYFDVEKLKAKKAEFEFLTEKIDEDKELYTSKEAKESSLFDALRNYLGHNHHIVCENDIVNIGFDAMFLYNDIKQISETLTVNLLEEQHTKIQDCIITHKTMHPQNKLFRKWLKCLVGIIVPSEDTTHFMELDASKYVISHTCFKYRKYIP